MNRSFLILFLILSLLSKAQNVDFREIKSPYFDNHVFIQMHGMIHEPGVLSNLQLSVSLDNGTTWVSAKTVYLLFPQGKEFHHGNLDSLREKGFEKSPKDFDQYSSFELKQTSHIYIDELWMRDARGEMFFNLLWDAMSDVGEIDNDAVLFKVEGDFRYEDETILNKSGVEATFTDPRDQQEYRMVQIGNMVWMGENLRYDAHFSKKKNDFVEKDEDGYKYSWWNAKKACPEGWRLPSEEDFQFLMSYYDNQKHLLPGGVSSLELQSILYDTYWEYWTGTQSEMGYITTYKFDWNGLEKNTNKASGTFTALGEWDKSLIRCVKDVQ